MSIWSDYRFYFILIIYLLITLVLYFIIKEGVDSGYDASLYKARWHPTNWVLVFLLLVMFVLLTFLIYYVNINQNAFQTRINNVNICVLLATVLVVLTVLAIYGLRNITAGFIFGILLLLTVIWLMIETWRNLDINYYSFGFSLLAIYLFLQAYNLHIRNVRGILPYDELSYPELVHYEALRRKHCVNCNPRPVYYQVRRSYADCTLNSTNYM